MQDQRVTAPTSGVGLAFDRRLDDFAWLEARQIEAGRFLRALQWKRELGLDSPLVAAVMGGTGTGKSTIFNSLAGDKISLVAVRRPSTMKPVIFAHEHYISSLAQGSFMPPRHERSRGQEDESVIIFTHRQNDLAGIILIDTPDFDSVEISNRVLAENFFVISDIVIFVTSQEKYGDLSGRLMKERAEKWGKQTIFVMNKVVSDLAFEDFRNGLSAGKSGERDPIRIERMGSSPEMIPGLRDRFGFAELLRAAADPSMRERTHTQELANLRAATISQMRELTEALEFEAERIRTANIKIHSILSRVGQQMEAKLEAVLSNDIEVRMQERLQTLLKKYDIFFLPRMIVRNAIRKALGTIAGLFFPVLDQPQHRGVAQERSEDLNATRSVVKLQPLEWAVARLNLEIGEFLSSDDALADLCRIAKNDIQRWGQAEISSLFDEAFPGVEELLKAEFDRLREGLSRTDEMKLYGSYTLWALLLITAEIVMGGGLTLLDVLLSSVVLPFIPKWLLSLKVLDLLKEIGRKVDVEYRHILGKILAKQAELYTGEFNGLLPDEAALKHVQELSNRLAQDLPVSVSFRA